jgi:DNA-binding MarR family transcriptional regulator
MARAVQGEDLALQERMIELIRAFGLHRPDRTPCGRPVSVSEAHAVTELARGAPLTQSDLAARLLLEKSTVSRLVAGLVARGWVERVRDSADGRAVRLHLTDRGARAAAEIGEARRRKFAAVVERIPDEERDAVLDALGVLAEAMRAPP